VKRQESLRPEFVEFIPDDLEEGLIYVSMRHATAAHLCACGCRLEVITPISPTDWQLTFDGETISLHPSIGNWSFPCQSHYVLKRGRIRWADQMTSEQIRAGRVRSRQRKERHAAGLPPDEPRLDPPRPDPQAERNVSFVVEPAGPGFLRRLLGKLSRRA
jgi:hypothetical protein